MQQLPVVGHQCLPIAIEHFEDLYKYIRAAGAPLQSGPYDLGLAHARTKTKRLNGLDGISETCSQTARQTDSAKHRHSEPASA